MRRLETWNAGRALQTVHEQVAAGDAYKRAREIALRLAVDDLLACKTVEDFKAAGGRTAIVERALARALLQVDCTANEGSKMFPMTAASLLRVRFHELRQEAALEEGRRRG
jgi:hypothetical protein